MIDAPVRFHALIRGNDRFWHETDLQILPSNVGYEG